jgi:hypothetical protein
MFGTLRQVVSIPQEFALQAEQDFRFFDSLLSFVPPGIDREGQQDACNKSSEFGIRGLYVTSTGSTYCAK